MTIKINANKKQVDQSKRIVNDIRSLLWIVTVGSMLLAFYCVYKNYLGALPWVAAMVGLPWAAYGVSQACYYSKSKAEKTQGGVVYEQIKHSLEQQTA